MKYKEVGLTFKFFLDHITGSANYSKLSHGMHWRSLEIKYNKYHKVTLYN